jgi:hypothetical protein
MKTPTDLETLNGDFLESFKWATESKWRVRAIDPTIFGFQFQPGTRWNPGLSEHELAEYQDVLGAQFPHHLKAFFAMMNGTDLPTVNVYGSSGQPVQTSVGVYSYPRDLDIIRQRIADVRENRREITIDLANQGFALAAEAGLVPIFANRYIVCVPSGETTVILSISVHDTDAIVYANSLREYLKKEFLGG